MDRLRQIKARLAQVVDELERRSFAFSVLMSAARAFDQDHCAHLAAGIAYYAIFSIFPLLLGLIALASFILQSVEVQEQIVSAAAHSLPGSSGLVRRNIESVLADRGTIGAVAAVTLLWSAKAVFGAITTSLNLAWDVPERRSFWQLTAIQMALVFGTGLFLAASLALTAAFALIPLFVGNVSGLALNTVAFLLLYRFLPCTTLRFADIWPGALVAGLLFEIAKSLYVIYTTQFANYQLVYGSLSAVIALLFWAWVSSAILLFGAEISAAYAKRRTRETRDARGK